MKVKRKIIEIDEELCDGCGECVTACEEGAIQIIEGKARVVKDQFCDGLGACIGDCPLDALKIVEREAEEFNMEAVKVHLEQLEENTSNKETLACGCPSTQVQTIIPTTSCQQANRPTSLDSSQSELSNWPIQIRLVPPTAPFLKEADLLIVADCVPAAHPNFHNDFMKGKKVLMGCPKLDDAESYVEKLAMIFKTAGIKNLTVPIMEVPCCSGLPVIVKKAQELAATSIPMEEVVVSIRDGIVLNRLKN